MNIVDCVNSDSDFYMRLGSHLDVEPSTFIWRETFAASTYRKYWLKESGELEETTIPVVMLLGSGWRFWRLECPSADICIGYHPNARKDKKRENEYWKTHRARHRRIPKMHGDIVVFRWHGEIKLSWPDIHQNIKNYLFAKYTRRACFK